jgi:hypothetical protein
LKSFCQYFYQFSEVAFRMRTIIITLCFAALVSLKDNSIYPAMLTREFAFSKVCAQTQPPVTGSSPPPISMSEECKNPPQTNLTECCSVYPECDQEKAQACIETSIAKAKENAEKKIKSDGKNSTESPSPMCCVSDCILSSYGFLKDGVFDAEFAKKSVAITATDKAWTPAVSW